MVASDASLQTSRERENVCVREREKKKNLKELAHITVGASKSEI